MYNPHGFQVCCGTYANSVWNVDRHQWECSQCGKAKSDDFDYFTPRLVDHTSKPLEKTSAPGCECGAEKTYGIGTRHMTYCPKHIKW